MKTCEYCGYDFEHNPATCKALVAEKKERIKHLKGSRTNPKGGYVAVSRKGILDLAEYLNGKRQ